MEKDRLYGLVLAGGGSSRMGEDKARLEIREGVSQLDWSLRALSPFCHTVWISVRDEDRSKELAVPAEGAVYDEVDIPGPMAGIIAGLKRAGGSAIFALACDMPYVDVAALLQLKSQRARDSLATCFLGSDGKPDPMCAIYEAAALSELEERASKEWFSLRRFLEGAQVERVKLSQSEWLASVNTPQDLEKAKRRFQKKESGF